MRTGPLVGVRVIELAGIGPGPFCAMMLADMGATVIRVERPSETPEGGARDPHTDLLLRGREIVQLDLKAPEDRGRLLRLIEVADVLLEGFRPGVLERLGLDPAVCLARNPSLIYARMTGWGQDGPMAHLAGHDINYFAMSGSLMMCGRDEEPPMPNLNLVADMGGGGMLMAFGIACALIETRSSGVGQVVDAAMTEGAAVLATMIHGYRAAGKWSDARGENLFDGGAPFYDVYRTADGGYMAVGSIEPKFYASLLQALGLDGTPLPAQHDRKGWPVLKTMFADIFMSRTRAEWELIFNGLDACVTPVLSPDEAAVHPHARSRGMFGEIAGVMQPMPAPRFSRTPAAVAYPPSRSASTFDDIMALWANRAVAA